MLGLRVGDGVHGDQQQRDCPSLTLQVPAWPHYLWFYGHHHLELSKLKWTFPGLSASRGWGSQTAVISGPAWTTEWALVPWSKTEHNNNIKKTARLQHRYMQWQKQTKTWKCWTLKKREDTRNVTLITLISVPKALKVARLAMHTLFHLALRGVLNSQGKSLNRKTQPGDAAWRQNNLTGICRALGSTLSATETRQTRNCSHLSTGCLTEEWLTGNIRFQLLPS